MVVLKKRLALQAAFFFCFIAAAGFAQNADPAAESHRAKELMAQSRFAEAVPIYEHLLTAYPGNTGLLLDLGLAEEMAGQPARAIPNFEAVLKTQPDNIPALTSLSMARMELNQSHEAIPVLQKLVQLDSDNPRAWYALGKAYESLAAGTFDRLSRSAPESGYVAVLLADTRLQRQQYRSAFFFYRQAQSKSPGLPGIHAGLAEVYRKTGHPDWAATEQQQEKALPAPDCKLQPAECAFLSARFAEAAKAAIPAASAATLFWATRAYNALAVQAFDRLDQLPESVEMHAFKAQLLHDHKQDLEASNEWRAALKLAPGDAGLQKQLAAALFDAKDYRSVMPLIENQLAQHPKAPDLNYLMGASLFRTEQAEKALPYLRTAVQERSDNLPADATLGLTLVALNKSAEAIPYLKRALPLDDDGSVHYSLARAYRAAGNSQLAAQTMQQYQKIQNQNRQINDELAKEAEITAPAR